MNLKARLMTKEEINRALKRISHQIAEYNEGVENVVLLGIERGGVPLAKELSKNLKSIENVDVPVGSVDITHYRDDLSEVPEAPLEGESHIFFDITGKDVILVDDVLFTGRTVRAALDATSKLGRAKSIQLAVLIDRGHRELPIRADYVGKNVPTSLNETIELQLDDIASVNLFEKERSK